MQVQYQVEVDGGAVSWNLEEPGEPETRKTSATEAFFSELNAWSWTSEEGSRDGVEHQHHQY